MATVFETHLIGNLGKDASVKSLDGQAIAINFPVAHNQNWKDKRSGQLKTKTTWINCTIWKQEGANLRILDFLKKGTLVELTGSPVSKAYQLDDGTIRSEIRLNVNKTNILRTANRDESADELSSDENIDDLYADDSF